VDLEIKPEDVRQLINAMEPIFDVARAGDMNRFPDFLGEQVDRMIAIRQEDDRGTREEAFAFWKVIGVILALGGFGWFLFKCGFFGCSFNEASGSFWVAAAGVLLAIFC
jgi:hypothetical protein